MSLARDITELSACDAVREPTGGSLLPSSTGSRVLIADDEARIRKLIGRALRREGFEVMEAEDGVHALELTSLTPPDLAIVDLRMPRMNGFEVVARLKARDGIGSMPVLVLSGMDEPEERVRAFEAGADDFIPKPVYIRELVKRVDAFERARRAYAELRQANARLDHLRMFANEAAALLAHDLNNGLSIVTANLQYVQEQLGVQPAAADPDMLDAVAAGRRALRRMVGLVRNFVDISRLEDAALKPTRLPTDLGELCRLAAGIHEPRTGGPATAVTVACPTGLRANIDPMLVERVLHNLLNNATRYVTPGGSIGIEVSRCEGRLRIGVGNTGQPIPRERRSALFAKYAAGSDGKAQRGMGLYFCRLACEAHGGSIRLVDHPVYETYFAIDLADAA
jgi:DNA-binding response OmpR family regulator